MRVKSLFLMLTLFLVGLGTSFSQTTTASLSGVVTDEKEAVIPGATVTVRNVQTGFTRTLVTDSEGRYSFVNLPIGQYELTVEAQNFSKYVQSGIVLLVNQNAVVNVALKPGPIQETITVTENASLLNTSTPEVSTRFDERRLSELPIAPNRSVYNVLLSVPGVSQLGSGQTGFANGISFSSNGGRLRSNNFMLDGQDINDPSVSGGQIGLNNPDAIQEVRIITNQFLAEYGRNSGSIVNFVSKSGTNEFRGTAFIFYNNENLNACSNLDKRAGFCNPNATTEDRRKAPFRKERQLGFTLGGPLVMPWFGDENKPYIWIGRDKTFFFVDMQQWKDQALGSGFTLRGAPTAQGRAILQQIANGSIDGIVRPQVQALLDFVPAGTPNGQSRTVTVGSSSFTIPLGDLTGSSTFNFKNHQGSVRIDHRFNDKNLIYGRYRFEWGKTSGTGQVTPPGLTTRNRLKTQAATIVWNSVLTSRLSNELRLAWSRFDSNTSAEDPRSETIPSIEIADLGMTGFNAAANRTAIGLAVNLPQFRINDTYQITNNLSYVTGRHTMKFGFDARRIDVKSFFFPTVRGRLVYTTLQNFINDVAQVATINLPLAGGDVIGFYRWYEFYAFAQDEWKITPNFTLTLGLRYEYPGDSFSYLKDLNQRILAANGNNPAFRLNPVPKTDKNNFAPRIGFNWNPKTSNEGIIGFITGGDKLVIRGGFARAFDANFININLNIFSSFPFVAAQNTSLTNAFVTMRNTRVPNVTNPNLLTRTIVAEDFQSPYTDQISLEVQRELSRDLILRVGYIRTRGIKLFQTVDGNPRRPCPFDPAATPTSGTCNLAAGILAPRVDPNRGVIRTRANSASSTYDALQISLDKRLSRGFSAGFHYTYSTFIDTASEIFNPSGAEVAIPQDPFNWAADRARSSYDRPHRFTGNFVYEFPFFRSQKDFVGKLLGGWQVNSFFTFQSGAPFTPLLGTDPAGTVNGIDGLVGNSIRPNVNTTLNLSQMSIPEILRAGGASLFRTLFPGQRVGNAGRNILRADSIQLVDFGIIKNTLFGEKYRLQIRADMFNVFNNRNFGIPEGRISAPNFLDQWGTNGGNRRIVLGARFVF
ncbi:MAG: TonB-dependent receptor [Pyrinomonadaceae bacterium]|nr:TonB-dependent receptor [Pyrinomonadaceae bacterium]